MKKQIIALILFILVLSGCAGPVEEPSSSVGASTRESVQGEEVETDFSDYIETPTIIYTTLSGENGLYDTCMYIDGVVKEKYEVNGLDALDIEAEEGIVSIRNISDDYPGWDDIQQQDEVRVYYVYKGYSSILTTGKPIGIYRGHEKLQDTSSSQPESSASSDTSSHLSGNNGDSIHTSVVNSSTVAHSNSQSSSKDSSQSSSQQTSQAQTSSTSQKKALDKANDYLRVMAFSRSGLVKQLEYEGYSNADATYAADHCGADWNAQALKKAKSYLDVMAFSYSGLKGQLEYDGFTSSQATYGVDNCGANWNDQAAKKAKSYLDLMSFSRDELISQLEYEGFTRAQAEYGAAKNGY